MPIEGLEEKRNQVLLFDEGYDSNLHKERNVAVEGTQVKSEPINVGG